MMTHSVNTVNSNKSKQSSSLQAESVEKSSQNEQEKMLNGNCTDNKMKNLSVADIEEITIEEIPNRVFKELTNLTESTTVVGKALEIFASIENYTVE